MLRKSSSLALCALTFLWSFGVTLGQDPAAKGAGSPSAPTPPAVTPPAPAQPPVATPPVTKPAPAPTTAPTPAPALSGGPVKRVSDPQAIAIVESYLKAIGGREVLAKIKDRATKFRNIKHAATGETVANINLLIKDSILIREEWDIEGFQIKDEKLAFNQIYNGKIEEGWVQMLGTVSPLDGRTLQVFVWDKQMDDFFCRWEEDGYTLSMGGQGLASKDIVGGNEDVPCDIVVVTDFSGRQEQRFFFSKKDSLLLKKEWQDAGSSPRATVKKEQYYKEYRPLPFMDGSGLQVQFALKLEIYLDGDLDTERQYTNVRFNSNLSDKLFEKPAGEAFKPAPSIGGSGGVKPPTAVSNPSAPPSPAEKPQEGSAGKAKVKKAASSPPSATPVPVQPPAEAKPPEAPKPAPPAEAPKP